MVYRFNRDPIIDDGRTLRVDRMRVNSFSKRGIGSNTTQGFRTGGAPPPGSTPDAAHNTIEKFPFSSDANATDVGDLTVARGDHSCTNSSISVYSAGGKGGSAGNAPATNVIDKFPISSGGNATDVGDLTVTGRATAGQQSTSNGYTAGGYIGPSPAAMQDRIDKYSFSSDANANDIGNLTVARNRNTGQSSLTHGYSSGGGTFPPFVVKNEIDKFPFSSDTNATDVGDLVTNTENAGGQSSGENGYASGGWGPGNLNVIQKFPFSADAGSSDVGDLTEARGSIGGGSSSENHGYASGGSDPSSAVNTIDKFPFSRDTNATDVGDLTISTRNSGAAQG